MVTAHPASHAVVPTRSVRAKAGGFAIYHRVEMSGKSKAARSAAVQRTPFNAFGVRTLGAECARSVGPVLPCPLSDEPP